MKEAKGDECIVGNLFKKISYSTGFICAKAARLKNNTTSLVEKTKDGLVDIGKSFKGGFEPTEERVEGKTAQKRGVHSKTARSKPQIKRPVSTKKKNKLTPTPRKKGTSSKKSQIINPLPHELLNADFEKEIKDISKEIGGSVNLQMKKSAAKKEKGIVKECDRQLDSLSIYFGKFLYENIETEKIYYCFQPHDGGLEEEADELLQKVKYSPRPEEKVRDASLLGLGPDTLAAQRGIQLSKSASAQEVDKDNV